MNGLFQYNILFDFKQTKGLKQWFFIMLLPFESMSLYVWNVTYIASRSLTKALFSFQWCLFLTLCKYFISTFNLPGPVFTLFQHFFFSINYNFDRT